MATTPHPHHTAATAAASCPSPQPEHRHPPQNQTPNQNHPQHQPTTPPQSHHPQQTQQQQQQHHGGTVRLMCSFGGRIYPRPHDNKLRYIGGETRIVAVNRSVGLASLFSKLSKLPGAPPVAAVKYQLPHEELDALISLANDEDVENMMDEYDRLAAAAPSRAAVPRFRVFLFPPPASSARFDSVGSQQHRFDSVGSQQHRFESVGPRHQFERVVPQQPQSWFVDALNNGLAGRLERLRSEVSSTVSEVPDYLFGLDGTSDSRTEGEPSGRAIGSEEESPVPRDEIQPQPTPENEPDVEEKPSPESSVHRPVSFSSDPNWPRYSPSPFPVYYIPSPMGIPVSYSQPVQIPVVQPNPVPPTLVYVSSSGGIGGGHYGLIPPVIEGYEPMSMMPVYPPVGLAIGTEVAVTTTADGRAVSSQSS